MQKITTATGFESSSFFSIQGRTIRARKRERNSEDDRGGRWDPLQKGIKN